MSDLAEKAMQIPPFLFHASAAYLRPEAILSADEIRERFKDELADRSIRKLYVSKFCFPVLCREAVEAIADAARDRRVLEIGSGTGYLAHILATAGVDIIATDPAPRISGYGQRRGFYLTVLQVTADEAIKQFAPSVLISSWPSYDDDWAAVAMEKMPLGSTIIYFGEGHGGCTGDARMHDFLDAQRRIARVDLPVFSGLYDDLRIYEVTAPGESKNGR